MITIERNALAEAVVAASAGIPGNPDRPIRGCMLIQPDGGKLSFTASDGDTTFISSCEAQGDLERLLLPGRLFTEIVRNLPAHPVTIERDGSQAVISCGRAVFRVATIAGDYPDTPKAPPSAGVIEGKWLADAFKKVAPAAARSHSEPIYTGVLLECADNVFTAVASDRYRIAAAEGAYGSTGETGPGPCVIPAWAAEKFARVARGTVSFGWGETVSMATGDVTIITRQLAGDFPKWRTILPQKEPDVEVNPRELTDAVKRARVVLDDNAPVELIFSCDSLTVYAGGHVEQLDAGYKSEDQLTLLLNVGYLLDGLSGCGETCSFGVTGPLNPVHIWSGDYKYMVLPRRRI